MATMMKRDHIISDVVVSVELVVAESFKAFLVLKLWPKFHSGTALAARIARSMRRLRRPSAMLAGAAHLHSSAHHFPQ